MAAKKNRFNHPRKAASGLGWKHLLPVLLLLVILLVALEWLKRGHKQEPLPEPVKPPSATLGQPPVAYPQQQYTSAVQTRRPAAASQQSFPKGSLAIVVDDMGSSMKEVQELAAINLPLTFAIIPGLPKVRGVAEYAHAQGRDVIIHIPMEPQGYPAQRVEANALLMSSSASEIESRIKGFIKEIPFVIGANNHMGSRFTESEAQMKPVIAALKENGLFFLDSRTSPKSVGQKLAVAMEVRTASRNVFLDNEQSVEAIKRELVSAARMAGKKGGAIAICHPHPATIKALRETMPKLAAEGTVFVNAAQLLR
ncbi:MAG: divergent polysaccharide deacetylase family protein [Geobacter sp.]|nr:divergent polysaccharide deacetylase family protein [Geobacter sp.]